MPKYEEPDDNMKTAYEKARSLPVHNDRLAGVDILVRAAYASRNTKNEPRGEAIARDGKPIFGKIRIMTLEDRSAGNSDVRIILHGDRWGSITPARQLAVLDGCLTRIEVMQEDGETKLDELDRPKLKKRTWEFQLCGFHDVAERNGVHSLEVANFRALFDEHGQLYLRHFDGEFEEANVFAIVPKSSASPVATGPKRGSLGAKPLCERIQHLDALATVLAVLRLEKAKTPRKGVIKALTDRALEMRAIDEFSLVDKGMDPSIALDLAAAVLVTTSKNPSTDLLDRLVPDCRDAQVLRWVLDDETGRGDDARDGVVAVVKARLEEIS